MAPADGGLVAGSLFVSLAPIAQLVEQLALNEKGLGSNPSGGT